MDLPRRVSDGVLALREERWSDACDALAPVYDDPDLAAADDLADVLTRVCSLYAQALLEAGRPHDADAACQRALRLARVCGDREGVSRIRELQDRVVAAIVLARELEEQAAERARIAAMPLADLLAGDPGPAERAELLVKKANALLDSGHPAEARSIATLALKTARAASSCHWEVMARLSLARSTPDRARHHLDLARELAEQRSEFNLISTIARAAELAGVTLTPHAGPLEGRGG